MRLQMKKFTTLTHSLCKTIEQYCYAIPLYCGYYNLVKQHKTRRTTRPMAAGGHKKIYAPGNYRLAR